MTQCRSRSVGFFRSQLIWIYTVCKGRIYQGSAGQGLKWLKLFKTSCILFAKKSCISSAVWACWTIFICYKKSVYCQIVFNFGKILRRKYLWAQVTRSSNQSNCLTFTTLWANTANDKLMIFSLFFPENRIWQFMQNWLQWRQFVWNAKSRFLGKK